MLNIALAQIQSYPGQLKQNLSRITEAIKEAKASGADIIVLPELALHGYMHLDLAHSKAYVERGKKLLKELATVAPDCGVVVGHLDFSSDELFPSDNSLQKPLVYNAASFLADGKVLATGHKMLLPDYQVFNESRYYAAGERPAVVEYRDQKIGILICEDLVGEHYPQSPLSYLKSKNTDLIVALNAAPFSTGKWEKRYAQVQKQARELKQPIYFTNLVGSYDGYDGEVVFDGRSFALDRDGNSIALASAFKEEVLVIGTTLKTVPFTEPESCADIYNALVLAIKEFFSRANHRNAVLGLSGGIDSAVVAALAVAALGSEHVTAITMPSHITSEETKSDAFLIAQNLGIQISERSIHSEFLAWKETFASHYDGKTPHQMTLQNKQARIRGALLMEFTNENPGTLLLTTGNKTELALGYCTLYGDMCGALAPIGDLNKSLVYDLARWINKNAGAELIPASVIERAPTAELEDGQTDEANLPAPYSELAPLVDRIIETDVSQEELLKEYSPKLIEQTLRLIDINEGKRRQAPPAIRVTRGSLGLETRMPMGMGYRYR